MPSLKEIKSRIQSVKSTQKITSAMKMVSSAKLRKAQREIENFYPYSHSVMRILNNFLAADSDLSSAFSEVRDIKRIAIIAFSSNGSLNGAFNSNVEKKLIAAVNKYKNLGNENILIFPIGKKIYKATKKLGLTPQGNFEGMADKPNFQEMMDLAEKVMRLYTSAQIDKVVLIYHHFKTKSTQELLSESLLPLELTSDISTNSTTRHNYIIEPNRNDIVKILIPKVILLRMYTALLDSAASEHAARVIAMQLATDNADDLLHDLSIQYNKSRQQAITNELLDIIGGSFGQS